MHACTNSELLIQIESSTVSRINTTGFPILWNFPSHQPASGNVCGAALVAKIEKSILKYALKSFCGHKDVLEIKHAVTF
jgi:hypothetical protein